MNKLNTCVNICIKCGKKSQFAVKIVQIVSDIINTFL